MTKREFYLKLFSENSIALTCAMILIERFVSEEQLKRGQDYILSRKPELLEEIPESVIQQVFPNHVE